MAIDLDGFSIDGFAFPILGWLDTGFFVNELAFPLSGGDGGRAVVSVLWGDREVLLGWADRDYLADWS